MAQNKLVTYAKKLNSLLNEKDRIKAELSKQNEKIDKFQFDFVTLMKKEKIQNFNVDGVGNCYVKNDVYVNVKDKEKLFKFLRKNKAGAMIKETVNAKTLKAFTREMFETKNKYPEGVEVTPHDMVVIKGRDKEE